MRITVVLTLLLILLVSCGEKITPQEEPQVAIQKLKAAYDKHRASFGSTTGYTVDEAIIDADIDDDILDRWNLRVYGDPPDTYLAVSTDRHSNGKGKRVVYDVAKDRYEGWMVNQGEE